MRPVSPIVGNSLADKVQELVDASQDVTEELADPFTISNLPAAGVYTLDISTATASDVAKVLGTFLRDMKNRGTKRVV
jgi:hypothetical protein